MLTITCGCGWAHTVSPALAGLTVLCHQCGKGVSVPGAPAAAPAPTAPGPNAQTPRVQFVPPQAPPTPKAPRPAAEIPTVMPEPPPRPWAKPVARPEESAPPPVAAFVMHPATRGQRLCARLIDSALALAVVLVAAFLVAPLAPVDLFVTIGMFIGLLVAVQVAFLSARGQHVGKWMLGLVIVRENGDRAGFMHAFLLRDGVTGLIGIIPGLGQLYKLVNDLFIFSESEKCLHDHIAGTRVMQLPGDDPSPDGGFI